MDSRTSVGIIYYTSNRLPEAIKDGCWRQIQRAGLPITVNATVVGEPGVLSMFKQIYDCLQRAPEDYVFFCEHDVLYHQSHFEFVPPHDDTFYYNTNIWGWDYRSSKVVTYDRCAMLSGLCVNRELAVEFYRRRLHLIQERGYERIPTRGCPSWALNELGIEPGKRGSDEVAKVSEWKSAFPNIDIRHGRSLTRGKKNQRMSLNDFRSSPPNWREDVIENLPGWNEPWTLVQP